MTLHASRIALGLWPLAGITTVGVTRQDGRETIASAIQLGINTFDTAYSYGFEGESDRLLGSFIRSERDHYRIISKVGQRWTAQRKRVVDGKPQQLIADAETNLRRIGIESLDLLMLHSPDPETPLQDSTRALCQLHRQGKCQSIGLCNASVDQLIEFHRIAQIESTPATAIQCPLNLLQRQSQAALIPKAHELGLGCHVYWTLMKGLLAGRIKRDHQFAEGDSRPNYEIFKGQARERAHKIVDQLATLGKAIGKGPLELSIGWTLSQPGVELALVGARSASQVEQIARAKPLDRATLDAVNKISSQA